MRARERRRLPRAAIVTIEITVFVALFAAVVFGLGYARDRLDRMVGHLREQVSVQVADRLGARVRYGTVAPSALRALQVSDLELLGASGDVLLSARRLRVHYSLRTLLSTRSAVDAVNRVELTGVVADLQLPRDQGPVSAALGGVARRRRRRAALGPAVAADHRRCARHRHRGLRPPGPARAVPAAGTGRRRRAHRRRARPSGCRTRRRGRSRGDPGHQDPRRRTPGTGAGSLADDGSRRRRAEQPRHPARPGGAGRVGRNDDLPDGVAR